MQRKIFRNRLLMKIVLMALILTTVPIDFSILGTRITNMEEAKAETYTAHITMPPAADTTWNDNSNGEQEGFDNYDGNGKQNFVGAYIDGGSSYERSALKFDLGAYIPEGSVITSAFLELNITSTYRDDTYPNTLAQPVIEVRGYDYDSWSDTDLQNPFYNYGKNVPTDNFYSIVGDLRFYTSGTVTGIGNFVIDVTDYIVEQNNGDRIATMVLSGREGDYNCDFGFESIENDNYDPALLVIEYTTLPKLSSVTGVTLTDQGVANWADTSDETGYNLILYKDGTEVTTVGEIQEPQDTTSYDFLPKMKELGAGTYKFSVIALGDGSNYADSEAVVSGEQTVTKLDKATGLSWSGNVAHWSEVSGATKYKVQLYVDSVALTDADALREINASDLATGVDFSSCILNHSGFIDFKVTAIGDGVLLLDSEESDPSPEIAKVGKVTNVQISEAGIISWDAAAHATNYTVTLYKDGNTTPIATNAVTGIQIDVSDTLKVSTGDYYATVYATSAYGSGDVSEPSNTVTVKQLGTATNLNWNDKIATWDAVADAVAYKIELYEDETNYLYEISLAAKDSGNEADFSYFMYYNKNYTFRVKAIGNGKLILDGDFSTASPVTKFIEPLSKASILSSTNGLIKWTDVTNAVSYTAKLYKENAAASSYELVATKENIATTNTSYDFLSTMRENGEGNYQVTVTAIADGTNYADSSESNPSPVVTLNRLPAVTSLLGWNSYTAKWYGVTDAVSYDVQLYYEGNKVGDIVNVPASEIANGANFQSYIVNGLSGNYTYTVIAKGSGLNLDSIESVAPPAIMKLDQVSNVQLMNTGRILWSQVTGMPGVSGNIGYTVQLYKDGAPYQPPTTFYNIDTNVDELSIINVMLTEGEGVYSYNVTAVGDGLKYLDGNTSEMSNQQTVTKLGTISNFRWEGNVAKWDAVPFAEKYEISLYENGVLLTTDEITETSMDYTSVFTTGNGGNYTVSVTAIGTMLQIPGATVTSAVKKVATPLTQATNVTLSEAGIASWEDVSNESGYSLQLYKNDELLGVPVLVSHDITSYDLLSIMRSAGAGNYKVVVTALGDEINYSSGVPSDESIEQCVIQLEAPKDVIWDTCVAHWADITDAVKYEIQLYKNSEPINAPITVLPSEAISGLDLSSQMEQGGAGIYTFSVKALGDDKLILDSQTYIGTNRTYTKTATLSAVSTGLSWVGNVAHWDTVTDAIRYEVQLYKDGNAVGTAVTVNAADALKGVDFTTAIKAAGNGVYTYKVIAKGNGSYLFDSAVSAFSNNNVKTSSNTSTDTEESSGNTGSDASNGTTGSTRTGAVVVDGGSTSSSLLQIPILRTLGTDGTSIDSVSFGQTDAKKTIILLKKLKEKEFMLAIPDIQGNSAGQISVALNGKALLLLADAKIGVTIDSYKADLKLIASTVKALNGKDVEISMSEVTYKTKIKETEKLLFAKSAKGERLGTPIDIRTNYAAPTLVTIPIPSSVVPAQKEKREEFLKSLAVLVQHSSGEVRLQKGTITCDSKGNPTGVTIIVDEFSTFTLVKASYDITAKTITTKQMPDKVWTYTFSSKLDATTINEDNVYVLDEIGSKVAVTLSCSGKQVTIQPPVEYYTSGKTYTVYFTTNVLYSTGKSIPTAKSYQFTIANQTLSGTKLKEYTGIEASKVWSINLEKAIDTNAFSQKSVQVVDQNGKTVKAVAKVVKNKYVKITPAAPYTEGKTYYIIIKDVKFKNGTSMKEANWIKFQIKK